MTPPMRRHWMTLLATLAIGVQAGPAASADTAPDLLSGRGFFSAGMFSNHTDLQIRFDPSSLKAGTEVDWDQRFGLADTHRFRAEGLWRFKPRHHLRFLYTDYSQTDGARIDKEIQWGEDLIPVNSDVTGRLGFEIVELAYEYSVLKRADYELAASVGVHYTALSAELIATLNSVGIGSRVVGGEAPVDAPLPVVGLRGLWRLGRNVYLDAQVQYFSLTINDIAGSLSNRRAALIWQPSTRWGVGVGYDAFEVDVQLKDGDFRGTVDWAYRGPQLFVNYTF
jgi:hypothetical protein